MPVKLTVEDIRDAIEAKVHEASPDTFYMHIGRIISKRNLPYIVYKYDSRGCCIVPYCADANDISSLSSLCSCC